MEGISSKAFGGLENNKKYNGIEFDQDLDIDSYEAFYRNLDPQTGRWWQIDPKIENMEAWSPYASNFDNPITFKDPLGDEPEDDGPGPGDPARNLAQAATSTLKSLWGGAAGATVGTIDNVFGSQLRVGASGSFAGDKDMAKGWNVGLNIADVGAIVGGAGESTLGVGLAAGSLGVTASSGGLTIAVSGPTFLLGAGLTAHGLMVSENGAANFASQSGRVNAEGNSTSGGQTYSGRPIDRHGNKLGPSGQPQVNTVRHSSVKKAKDAARNEGKGAPVKHTNPKKGNNHFHKVDKKGNKAPNSTHHEYPK